MIRTKNCHAGHILFITGTNLTKLLHAHCCLTLMTMATLVNYTHYRLIKLTSGFLVNLVSACEEQSVLCEKSKRAAKMRCLGWRKGRLVMITSKGGGKEDL